MEGRRLVLSHILLEAVIDRRGRIARCHSSRNQTAKTPHCNHLPQLALGALDLAIYPSFPPPPGSPHDRPRTLEPRYQITHLPPFSAARGKIMSLIQFLLVFSKQLSLVSRVHTSL